jgi:hypothetical protein
VLISSPFCVTAKNYSKKENQLHHHQTQTFESTDSLFFFLGFVGKIVTGKSHILHDLHGKIHGFRVSDFPNKTNPLIFGLP